MKSTIPSKICVSIGESSSDACIKALAGVKFAEIRIDKMESPTPDQIKRLFSSHRCIIATCRRTGTVADEAQDRKRKYLLLTAIDAGAAFVDVEVEAPKKYVKELVAYAKIKNVGTILSFHDHEKTPPTAELEAIIKRCFERGADIAKIACMVNKTRDAVRLLGLLGSEDADRIIVIGMGDFGKVTRVVAPVLGSPFTFAKLNTQTKETGAGQLEQDVLEKCLELLGRL